MKDKNGINTECYNCAIEEICKESVHCGVCKIGLFLPSKEAYEDRIEDLQNELTVIQESERAEAQEADKLRAEVRWLKKENERLSKEIIDLGTGTLAEKNYQLLPRRIISWQ